MSDPNNTNQWKTLDKDLGRINQVEVATQYISRPLLGLGLSLVFIVLAGLASMLFFGQQPTSFVVIAAAVFGAYMALNIGANDVANNMGPAVGAKALPLATKAAVQQRAEVNGHGPGVIEHMLMSSDHFRGGAADVIKFFDHPSGN